MTSKILITRVGWSYLCSRESFATVIWRFCTNSV